LPLRREVRKFYDKAWRDYRQVLMSINGTACSVCLCDVPRYLNFAHLTHDPRNNALVAGMCASCHAIHDTKQRIAMTRRTRARRAGQTWLWVEVEWAPYPESFWPRRVIMSRQLDLFL
jgi:hypothetical protein